MTRPKPPEGYTNLPITLTGCKRCGARHRRNSYGQSMTCAACLEKEIERLRKVLQEPPMTPFTYINQGGIIYTLDVVDQNMLAKLADGESD